MTASFKTFSGCVLEKTKKINERIIAFLYYRAETKELPEATISEIIQDFIDAGLGSPNRTRLKKFLVNSPATVKVGKDQWRLKSDRHGEASSLFGSCLNKKNILTETDSVIPSQIIPATPKYLAEVVKQINKCYDIDCFDASGVMLRRLVETLIIEVYEHIKIESKIKDTAGNYFMLNELIKQISSESIISLGRNAKKGLTDAKSLGDLSAHNRRFLAKEPDINKIQANIRVLVQELIVLAGL